MALSARLVLLAPCHSGWRTEEQRHRGPPPLAPPRFGADRMSSNERSEARSVILRLRRYRDRIEEITRVEVGGVAAGAPAGVAAQRRLVSLKNDLDHDSHECEIGRRRAVQSDCEHMFLWPALREAAGAMMERSAPPRAGRSCKRGTAGGPGPHSQLS